MSEHIIETEISNGALFIPYQSKLSEAVREEIVRCRDCRRYHPKEGEMLSCRFEYKDFVQWRSAEPNGYCAWGERKEGGE